MWKEKVDDTAFWSFAMLCWLIAIKTPHFSLPSAAINKSANDNWMKSSQRGQIYEKKLLLWLYYDKLSDIYIAKEYQFNFCFIFSSRLNQMKNETEQK